MITIGWARPVRTSASVGALAIALSGCVSPVAGVSELDAAPSGSKTSFEEFSTMASQCIAHFPNAKAVSRALLSKGAKLASQKRETGYGPAYPREFVAGMITEDYTFGGAQANDPGLSSYGAVEQRRTVVFSSSGQYATPLESCSVRADISDAEGAPTPEHWLRSHLPADAKIGQPDSKSGAIVGSYKIHDQTAQFTYRPPQKSFACAEVTTPPNPLCIAQVITSFSVEMRGDDGVWAWPSASSND